MARVADGLAVGWRHTRRGDKDVTVIIDLTPIRDGTGPARPLDMVEGPRSLPAPVQQNLHSHRGRKDDPLHKARRTPHAGAYRQPDRVRGRALMGKLIASVSTGVAQALREVTTLGRR